MIPIRSDLLQSKLPNLDVEITRYIHFLLTTRNVCPPGDPRVVYRQHGYRSITRKPIIASEHVLNHFTVVCSVPWPLNGSDVGGELVFHRRICLNHYKLDNLQDFNDSNNNNNNNNNNNKYNNKYNNN